MLQATGGGGVLAPPERAPIRAERNGPPTSHSRSKAPYDSPRLWYPVAVLLTLHFSSVAMRLGPVLAGPVHSCVGAAERFAAVCCVRGGGGPRDKLITIGLTE